MFDKIADLSSEYHDCFKNYALTFVAYSVADLDIAQYPLNTFTENSIHSLYPNVTAVGSPITVMFWSGVGTIVIVMLDDVVFTMVK